MLNKLKNVPTKVILAIAMLLAMFIALVILVPVAALTMGLATILWWSINTLLEHYIQ
jgi:hypothetical protein